MTKRVLHFAEVGLRVNNLPKMASFYQEMLGFDPVIVQPELVFLNVGDVESSLGKVGHPQMLVLFKREADLDINLTTLDHLAFEIPDEFYDEELARFSAEGMIIKERSWPDSLYWRARSFFFHDPEGNVIELIAAHS